MLLVLLTYLLHFCNGQGAGPGPGEIKYVINFDSPIYAYGEDSKAFINTDQVEVERFNETTAFMHGEIAFLQDLSNAILQIVLCKETSGKFEVVFTHDICNLCAELGDEGSQYKKYLKYFGFPSECPIGAGVYKIHDWVLDFDEIDIESHHEGRYEAQLKMYSQTGESCQQDKELKCVLKMDLIIEPGE